MHGGTGAGRLLPGRGFPKWPLPHCVVCGSLHSVALSHTAGEGMAEEDDDLPPFKFVFNPRSILKLRKVRESSPSAWPGRPSPPLASGGNRTVASVRAHCGTTHAAHSPGRTRAARRAPRCGRARTAESRVAGNNPLAGERSVCAPWERRDGSVGAVPTASQSTPGVTPSRSCRDGGPVQVKRPSAP